MMTWLQAWIRPASKERLDKIWRWLRQVENWKNLAGALGVLGVAVTVGNFWYTTYYSPATSAPTLTLAVSMTRGASHDGLVPITATLSVKNTAKTRVFMLGNVVNVWGLTISARTDESDAAYAADMLNVASEVQSGAHSALEQYAYVRHSSENPHIVYSIVPFLSREIWFDPGEEVTRTFVFHVPEDRYGTLRLYFYAFVGRKSVVLDTVAPNYWSDPETGAISYQHSILRLGGCDYLDATRDDLDTFGLMGTFAVADLAVWPTPTAAPTGKPTQATGDAVPATGGAVTVATAEPEPTATPTVPALVTPSPAPSATPTATAVCPPAPTSRHL